MEDSVPDNPVKRWSYPLYYNKINNNMTAVSQDNSRFNLLVVRTVAMVSVVILVLAYVGITVSQETNKPDVADMIADCRTICGDTFYNCLIIDCQSDSVLCDKRCTVSFRECYSGCETFRLDKEPSTSFTENDEPYKSNDE